MTPHVARCAEAVQHDHCRAMTADPHMDGYTVGFDRPRLHHSREGINSIYVGMLAHFVYSRFASSWGDRGGRLSGRSRLHQVERTLDVAPCTVGIGPCLAVLCAHN